MRLFFPSWLHFQGTFIYPGHANFWIAYFQSIFAKDEMFSQHWPSLSRTRSSQRQVDDQRRCILECISEKLTQSKRPHFPAFSRESCRTKQEPFASYSCRRSRTFCRIYRWEQSLFLPPHNLCRTGIVTRPCQTTAAIMSFSFRVSWKPGWARRAPWAFNSLFSSMLS